MWGQILQIGHIGEPEVRTNGNGKTYVRFGINMAKKVGDDPMWLNCILGGPLRRGYEGSLEARSVGLCRGRIVLP
mgnify:CR=1 FL=1